MQFEFRPYHRSFRQPLQTYHGAWRVRSGIILRLVDDRGQVGFGEIAPLEWFGSESFEQALEFCQRLPTQITPEIISSIPDNLPACQFGFESAKEWASDRSAKAIPKPADSVPRSYSALLAAGETALDAWQPLWEEGYRTFKWKIGMAAIDDEVRIFERLMQALPPDGLLRLDANGGLSYSEATQWLRVCRATNTEFIEQPLPVTQFGNLLELSQRHTTPIAIDESVATLTQLKDCHQKGWRGIFVIKPAIAGSPSRLQQFCQNHQIDAVFSSVFETAIGRQAGLQLAAKLSHPDRALSYGTTHWFDELMEDDDRLWKRL